LLARASAGKDTAVKAKAAPASKAETQAPPRERESSLEEFTLPTFAWNIGSVGLSAPGNDSRTNPGGGGVSALASGRWARLPWPIQPKLEVGAVDDPLEREADRVAEQVMRMRDPAPATTPTQSDMGSGSPTLSALPVAAQRKAALSQDSGTIASAAGSGMEAPPLVHEVLRSPGQPLDAAARAFFEPRFSHSFEQVRIHTDPAAAASAREVNALAYTRGQDIVFASGQFAPTGERGQRLLAHELTHVVQQGGAEQQSIRRSYLAPSPEHVDRWELPKPPVTKVGPAGENTTVRRAPASDDATTAPPAPKLVLTPGDTLTRGDTLTARVDFTPTAGERLTVNGWKYTTADGDMVSRPARDAGFQHQWQGVMAVSGNMELSYTIKPKSGAAGPPVTVTSAVTVSDRTGPDWKTTIEDVAEAPLTGGPSPPEQAEKLGLHVVPGDLDPAANHDKIAKGPNAQFEYVTLVTDRSYKSQPFVHPDVTNPDSVFRRFHRDAGRLYFVPGGNRTNRILIPLTEYRVVSATGNGMVFTVPDWNAFFKRHNILTVTCSAMGRTVTAKNEWWNLDLSHMVDGMPDGRVNLTADGARAARAALGITDRDTFENTPTANGAWERIPLMPSGQILPRTQSHEYRHPVHSHRANVHAMVEALDPRRLLESTVATPTRPIDFRDKIHQITGEIQKPVHELVDKAASQTAGRFVPLSGKTMAAINQDPDSGAPLGLLWDITHDQVMR
jgi:Domain of unknown function (DUF4157)